MRKILLVTTLFFISPFLLAQELKKEYQVMISNFIECVRKDKTDAIADMVHYPFNRDYPLPSIKSKHDFIENYNTMFDEALKNEIISSNPAKDWSEMGWRGIMLNQGTVRINFDGKILSIPTSAVEEINRKKIIEEERMSLHSSLKSFLEPICVLETTKFRIRIDDMGGSYRYASWPIGKSMDEKPDLILEKGEVISEGTGGNHSYKFINGEYSYECAINILGARDTPPANLIIYKKDQEILSQRAALIKK